MLKVWSDVWEKQTSWLLKIDLIFQVAVDVLTANTLCFQ
jgi:hypothetical protein